MPAAGADQHQPASTSPQPQLQAPFQPAGSPVNRAASIRSKLAELQQQQSAAKAVAEAKIEQLASAENSMRQQAVQLMSEYTAAEKSLSAVPTQPAKLMHSQPLPGSAV